MNKFNDPNRLREQREQSRLTVKEVGKLLGVDHSTITRWENGSRNIPLAMVPELAKLFKCQSYELFHIEGVDDE